MDSSGNLSIPTDTGRLKLGASDDLQIYHDGSNSFIRDMGTGVLFLDTDGTKIQLAADGTSSKTLANFIKDGAVELYHNGNLRFTTSDGGAELTRNSAGNDCVFIVENESSDSASDAAVTH